MLRAMTFKDAHLSEAKNVLGTPLENCSSNPLTGFYRTGCCETGPEDVGVHVICAEMTDVFLSFSKAQGNDLSTPRPEFGFAGLKAGDKWCLCAARWKEALMHDAAPIVILRGCHEKSLEIVSLEDLLKHADTSDHN